jgi:hypothetical protein
MPVIVVLAARRAYVLSCCFKSSHFHVFEDIRASGGISRNSSFGIATGYGLDGRSLMPGMGKRFFFSQRPDRLSAPPSLLSNEYRGIFPRGKAAEA